MVDIKIRYSDVKTDLEPLSRWLAHPDVLPNIPVEGQKEISWWLDYIFSYTNYNASLTAYTDEGIVAVGTLLLLPYEKLSHHSPLFFIVDPEKWRKGIGSSFLKDLLNLASKRFKIELVTLESAKPSNLLGFCEKNGFSEFACFENWFEVKGKKLSKICLEKEL